MSRSKQNSGKAPASQTQSRYASLARSRAETAPKFTEVLAARLGLALDAMTEAGDAILIARTSDGGAIAITILEGDERHKLYATSQQQLDDVFADLSGS